MQIKLLSHTRRTQGAALFLGILVLLGVALGGCAAYSIIKKAKEIERKRQQQATNDLVEAHFDFPAQYSPPAPYTGPIQEDVIDPVTGQPKFQVNTNAYNPELEDESGF